ncbi:TonB-dependent receptor [Gelidibacter sp.]|uniref:SusC/RagA family TonB-linked outer membrane protein n=1 Tax=Gelidibacter sp. TaxID=2018083 RepID=UPI002C06E613|nr:TonB-dependent receptor [Gelidibacter sp.]HUH28035.1 TonB-dependent receptor [Gelidibacter sp.]
MKTQIKYCLQIIVVLFFGGAVCAQKITGVVSSANGPLAGVNIIEKGTSNGAATDFDGNYSITVLNPQAILVFSELGFETQEIPVNGQTQINVLLAEDLQALDEVVLVGYSSRKKSTLTGAVSVVNMNDLEKTRVVNVTQALQGQVAGVQVTASTGAPGDAIQVRIRGEGTVGNNDPLYVIDGIPTRDISFLNQADIQSMSILKDASAAAIYGSRAAGGVVLITTKSGQVGKVSFDVSYYSGIHYASNLPKMLNAEQYINTVEKAWNNSSRTGSNPYTADRGRTDFSDTDWLDELFETGRSQNFQFTASGGSDKVQFLTSLGYYHQDGIVIYDHDSYKRLNYRVNLNVNLTERLKIGTNLQLTYATQDALSSKGDEPGIIRHALLRPPVLGVYKNPDDPTYSVRDPFTDLPFYKNNDRDNGGWESDKYEWSQNPIALAYFTDDVRRDYRTFGNIYAEYSFLKDKELTFRTNVGIDLSFFHNKRFNENFGDDDGGGNETDKGLGRQNRPNNLNEDRGESRTITFNNTLNYAKTLNEVHDISVLVGTEFIENYDSSIGASRMRFDNTDNTFRYIDYGSTEVDLWNGGSASEWALFSFFGSGTYVYDSKYMVTANFRADASSRFSENNRWGYFPSISVGWKISDENFLKNVSWLSNLKLRAGWGQLGNQEIDNYAYLTLISQVDGKVVVKRYGNDDLKWETSESSNFGIDFGFLDNKLSISTNYFVKRTTDILLPVGLPSIVGDVSPTIVNAGEVINKGFEFTLNYRNSDNAFKYGINANFGTLLNSVEKLQTREVGQSLNSFFGYKMVGIYQNQEEINSYLSGTPNPSAKPGDIKFADLNNDGIINSDDRTFTGDAIPDLTYGLSLSASYKGFDFSCLFQGVEGVDKYNDARKIVDYDTRPFNYTTDILGAWDGEGSTNSIPRVTFEDNGSSKESSIYVEDASYFRLKNAEIGYTINSLVGVQDIRLYISGQNLFTVTKYSGLDPESTDSVDKGTYPLSSSVLFGINVKF